MKITHILIILVTGAILFTTCQQSTVTSAKVYINEGNYDKAIEQCKLAIEQTPENPDAYYVLGQAYGSKKMYKEKNDAYNKSLELSNKYSAAIEKDKSKHWFTIFQEGVNFINQGNMEEAADKFKIAIELVPDMIDAYKNLAYTYTQMNDNSSAIETYIKAVKIDSTDLELQNFLGVLYYQNKDYNNAIKILKKILSKADPQTKIYQDALYNLAYSYDLNGEADKAIETYENALTSSPNDKDLMFNMGRLYFIQEKYDKAIESFQKVSELDPNDFDVQLNIGNAYINIAQDLDKKIRALDDKGKPILSEAEIAEKTNLCKDIFTKAIPYLERATQIKPDNWTAWNNLGVAYVRAGMIEKGKEAFEKAETLKEK